MACNCTKCSSQCGCADTALTNACTYTDCSVGSERCSDVQCAECVSYCGTSFQIGDAASKNNYNKRRKVRFNYTKVCYDFIKRIRSMYIK